MSYTVPVKEMLFVMENLADLDKLAGLPGLGDSNSDTARAVLEEGAKLSAQVVAPLNLSGDQSPSACDNGKVTASPGFGDAYRQFIEGGWQGTGHPVEFGGQGLAKLVSTPCIEMLNAANVAFALCPLLTDGAIEALLTAGSDELKARYLPKLIEGVWSGTMNLTEPQAGSDLSLVRSRAERQGDGSYKVFGTKIFITWGEHDMAENIVHLVLARTPDAPEGVKGISLFVVPKYLPNEDGSLGERNDVHCVSIEHKLGIKASPTAVLQYGDNGGATGFLVGDENRGLEYMFIMMNAARFAVGMQGIAISEAAYQKAATYAKERIQSRPVDGSSAAPVAIIEHPDVRRMLGTMRALTEGARALAYVAAAHHDVARHHEDPGVRAEHAAMYEYLVPVVKGWSTEVSVDVASLGVQVHGGMGFIEETGAAQFYRDARILPIYEGTTAIQANDLVGRKTLRDGGSVVNVLLARIDATLAELEAVSRSDAGRVSDAMYRRLTDGRAALARVVKYVLERSKSDPNAVFAGSVLYLKLAGIVLSGWQMARALLVAQQKRGEDPVFCESKIATAHCFAEYVLTQAGALAETIVSTRGDDPLLALTQAHF
jgi:alkylation response protein AidB-like acyl-CoA dehydrogenase